MIDVRVRSLLLMCMISGVCECKNIIDVVWLKSVVCKGSGEQRKSAQFRHIMSQTIATNSKFSNIIVRSRTPVMEQISHIY